MCVCVCHENISPASVEILLRDYERAIQDMKNRQNTENLETTM